MTSAEIIKSFKSGLSLLDAHHKMGRTNMFNEEMEKMRVLGVILMDKLDRASNLYKNHKTLLEKNKRLTEHNTHLETSLKVKNKNIARLTHETTFIRSRIKTLYGLQAYMELMAHFECPGGFDIENYKQKNGLGD